MHGLMFAIVDFSMDAQLHNIAHMILQQESKLRQQRMKLKKRKKKKKTNQTTIVNKMIINIHGIQQLF